MRSHQGRLYHAGGLAPARSTFADANRSRNPEVFSGLFMHMLGMVTRGLRRKLGNAVRLIDSTSGTIRFRGQDITKGGRKLMEPIRGEMQMVFQDPQASLNPRKRIGQILATPLGRRTFSR